MIQLYSMFFSGAMQNMNELDDLEIYQMVCAQGGLADGHQYNKA